MDIDSASITAKSAETLTWTPVVAPGLATHCANGTPLSLRSPGSAKLGGSGRKGTGTLTGTWRSGGGSRGALYLYSGTACTQAGLGREFMAAHKPA